MAKGAGGVRDNSSESTAVKEARVKYGSYDSAVWQHTYFNGENGGFVVTHNERIEKSKTSKQEGDVFRKEQEMCCDLAEAGHQIEHLSDNNRPSGQTYDIHFDGVAADLKSVSSSNNIEKYAKHAVREQGAKVVFFKIDSSADKAKTMKAMRDAKRKYNCRIVYYFDSDKTVKEL